MIRFVTAANGNRMFSESEVIDLLECIQALGIPLDDKLEKASVLEMERLVCYVM